MKRPKLTELRKIAWNSWDPIGLARVREGWSVTTDAADEYDAYIGTVAGMIMAGRPEAIAVDYLVGIEREHMGLSGDASTKARAQATVRKVSAYVDSLPD